MCEKHIGTTIVGTIFQRSRESDGRLTGRASIIVLFRYPPGRSSTWTADAVSTKEFWTGRYRNHIIINYYHTYARLKYYSFSEITDTKKPKLRQSLVFVICMYIIVVIIIISFVPSVYY